MLIVKTRHKRRIGETSRKENAMNFSVTCSMLMSKSKRGKSCLTATNTGYSNRPTAHIRGRAALRLPVRRRRCAFKQHPRPTPRFFPPPPTAPPKRYSDSEEFVSPSISIIYPRFAPTKLRLVLIEDL